MFWKLVEEHLYVYPNLGAVEVFSLFYLHSVVAKWLKRSTQTWLQIDRCKGLGSNFLSLNSNNNKRRRYIEIWQIENMTI